MIKRLIFISVAVFVAGCTTLSFQSPPAFTLRIPPTFDHAVKLRQFKVGDYLLNSPPYVKRAAYPIAQYFGGWGPEKDSERREHAWSIEVSLPPAARLQKIVQAQAKAADGYDAGNIVDETGSYMFARFGRKEFRWGKAFVYLTQFTQDSSAYVPHNGHLTYEVWGVATDGRHVVHANFLVTHSQLASWGAEVRDAASIEAMKKDPDYMLVESCPADDFDPSLAAIDKMMNSLQIK